MKKHTKLHQGLVLLASFIGQVISEGIMLSFTVYYPTLAKYFNSTNAEISLIGSFAYGCWFVLGGPLAGHFVAKFGSTAVLVSSGLVGAAAIFAGAFAVHLWQVILVFGIFAFCCGLSFIPAITVITNYYNRHKGLATTAATVGGAAGAVAYPMLVQYILTEQTWQYGFIITSGVMLQLVLCGMILSHNPIKSDDLALEIVDAKDKELHLAEPPNVVVVSTESESEHTCKTNLNLALYAVHNLWWNFTVFGFLTVIPLFLNSKGFNVTEIATLISVFSVLVIVGRCASALFCLWKNGDRVFVYNLATLVSAIFVALFMCDAQFTTYCLLAACYGFCFGIETGFVPIVTIDIVGHKADINKSLGLVLLATGAGGLVSPYASGWFADFMNSYGLIFLIGALANFLCCFLILHLHWPLKRKSITV